MTFTNSMWPTSNSIKHIRAHIHKQLAESFPEEHERNMIASMILQHITGLSRTELAINSDLLANESDIVWLKNILEGLNNHQPIQHLLGYETFYGLTFKVNPNVLIPRPETEELVKWILDDHLPAQSPLSVLDLGTGSGCIAIALKHERPQWSISAIDKSIEALNTAQANAEANHLEVDFSLNDLLNFSPSPESFDIIVSNPPYIRESEKEQMHKNVLDFEPPMALFVSDHDPLLFYRKIAQLAQTQLKPNGQLYFEINEALGHETVLMLQGVGYQDIELKEDLFGKHRMIKCLKQK